MDPVGSCVIELASRLEENGIGSSRVNAEAILSHVLDCRIIDLYTKKLRLGPGKQRQMKEMAKRRIEGEPLQYIIGKVDFYGSQFFIEEGVFIPRPETEILVETVLGLIANRERRGREYKPLILDLCTGSGNIAISLTKTLTHCKIIASDISDKAINLARKNARFNSVEERIEFIKVDLLDLPAIYSNSFSIIVSNPPYVARDILKGLPDEVKKEPYEALDGGDSGTVFYSRIIENAPRFLKKGGLIALELGDNLYGRVEELFRKQADTFGNIKAFKDLNGIDRVITAYNGF